MKRGSALGRKSPEPGAPAPASADDVPAELFAPSSETATLPAPRAPIPGATADGHADEERSARRRTQRKIDLIPLLSSILPEEIRRRKKLSVPVVRVVSTPGNPRQSGTSHAM